ncbi:hypothetical protein CVT24_000705 [Panaeolus cyanescens]|uniref:Uncharacterized protein n=1 Tax=Panaeolus cyanescens TaxID=181874 RepID=A0A409YT70_9AGAR|nr:hypothetical protein CVT24_000705 [Panaeolus cyanescens]
MYGRETPSPIFDAPDFPALRRMKPLPKRRRTAAVTTSGQDHITLNHQQSSGMTTASFSARSAAATSVLIQQGLDILQQHQQHHNGQSALGMLASATTGLPMEEFLNGTEPLSARMALQNYYMPILGTVQSFLAANAAAVASGNGVNPGDITEDGTNPNPSLPSLDNTATTANTAAAAAAAALAAITGAATGRGGQLPVSLADLDSIEFGVHFAAAAAAAAAAGVAMGGLGFGFPGMNMGHVPTSMPMPMPMTTSTGTHSRDEGDSRGDGDYLDHMQQPGNTKKRKVPANVGGSPRGGSGRSGEGGEDSEVLGSFMDEGHLDDGQSAEQGGRDRNGNEYEYDSQQDRQTQSSDSTSATGTSYPPPPFPGQLSLVVKKRGKMTAVTLAGLQHKEMLKSRKRQLAAVMGALSHGDTLALDQALSASFPLLSGFGSVLNGSGVGDEEERKPRQRKSKRLSVRLTRAMKSLLETPERRIPHPDAVPFPSGPFTFVSPSETADRLVATKAEVASLRNQFERELERQANKVSKVAVQAGGNKAMARAGGGKAKRERLERERMARVEKAQSQKTKAEITTTTTTTTTTKEVSNSPAVSNAQAVPSLPGGGKSKAKKKKRSALANASNPHHLRNYVPSRLPNSGSGGDGGNGPGGQNANLLWPLPIRFLTAEIPPRRKNSQAHYDQENQSVKKTKTTATAPLPSLIQPNDEWICAFCEYDLFYGSDAAFRRGVRNRKKILKRRRRARERAAAAASGTRAAAAKGAPPPTQDEQDFDEYEDDEGDVAEYGTAPAQNTGRVKAGPDKDGTDGQG